MAGDEDEAGIGVSGGAQDLGPFGRGAVVYGDAFPARLGLTRDAREVERKKYGQPGARKRFQFSKR